MRGTAVLQSASVCVLTWLFCLPLLDTHAPTLSAERVRVVSFRKLLEVSTCVCECVYVIVWIYVRVHVCMSACECLVLCT